MDLVFTNLFLATFQAGITINPSIIPRMTFHSSRNFVVWCLTSRRLFLQWFTKIDSGMWVVWLLCVSLFMKFYLVPWFMSFHVVPYFTNSTG